MQVSQNGNGDQSKAEQHDQHDRALLGERFCEVIDTLSAAAERGAKLLYPAPEGKSEEILKRAGVSKSEQLAERLPKSSEPTGK